MQKAITILSIFLLIHISVSAQHNILIITGGHDFEKAPFYKMFDSFQGIYYDTIAQPFGNEMLISTKIREYSALVFYDMYQEITEDQKAAMIKLLDEGLGMVFLHHSLVSYQDWPEFKEIIGGKYYLEATSDQQVSTYRHDVDMEVEIARGNDDHPITKGMKNFQIHDEVYGNFSVGNHVTPIITTNHPESTTTIGWCHEYSHSRIVYLQLGHDHHAYENAGYRTLVRRSIEWVSQNH